MKNCEIYLRYQKNVWLFIKESDENVQSVIIQNVESIVKQYSIKLYEMTTKPERMTFILECIYRSVRKLASLVECEFEGI